MTKACQQRRLASRTEAALAGTFIQQGGPCSRREAARPRRDHHGVLPSNEADESVTDYVRARSCNRGTLQETLRLRFFPREYYAGTRAAVCAARQFPDAPPRLHPIPAADRWTVRRRSRRDRSLRLRFRSLPVG